MPFTPNDVIHLKAAGYEQVEFKIFNRWSELVFKTNNFTQGWNGTLKGKVLNPSIFVYYLEGEFMNGNTFQEKM